MEGILFGWLGSAIYDNGHLTPVAGSIMIVMLLVAITKYFIYPTNKRLERIEKELFPSMTEDLDTSYKIVQKILNNQSIATSDSVLQDKTVRDMERNVSDIKASVGKIEAMFSILGVNTSRGIK